MMADTSALIASSSSWLGCLRARYGPWVTPTGAKSRYQRAEAGTYAGFDAGHPVAHRVQARLRRVGLNHDL
jgi:hypothetical protein